MKKPRKKYSSYGFGVKKYFCTKCLRTHTRGSKVFTEHWGYRSQLHGY